MWREPPIILDPKTALVLGAMATILLGLLLAVVRNDLSPFLRPAVSMWLRGSLMLPIGFAMLAARGQISDLLSIFVANVLIALAFADYLRAICALLERKPPLIGIVTSIAVVAIGSLVFSYVMDRVDIRTLLSSSALAWLAGMGALTMLRRSNTKRAAAQTLTGLVFALACGVFLVRVAFTFLDPAAVGSPLDANLMQATTFATGALLPIIASFGFLLLCTERMRAELLRTAEIDFLTGILNRGALEQNGARTFARARRRGSPCAVIVIDIDHFKRVNDAFGHAIGDQALRLAVERLRAGLRSDDTLGRLGGEEFLLLLDDSNEAQAMQAAERMRRALCEVPLTLDTGALPVTISQGVAVLNSGDTSFSDLLRRADRALYVAKEKGRNRSELADEKLPPLSSFDEGRRSALEWPSIRPT